MKIIVGTKNKKKVAVVIDVFRSVLGAEDVTVESLDADSKVPEAPHDEETYLGAYNRAIECVREGGSDYYIGIESGLLERYGNMFEEAWAVIISDDGSELVGYSSGLMLPKTVVARMNDGQKHNEVMAYFDKEFNLPDDNRDTWSRYTGGTISRQVSLEEALRNALIQSVDSERNLYKHK